MSCITETDSTNLVHFEMFLLDNLPAVAYQKIKRALLDSTCFVKPDFGEYCTPSQAVHFIRSVFSMHCDIGEFFELTDELTKKYCPVSFEENIKMYQAKNKFGGFNLINGEVVIADLVMKVLRKTCDKGMYEYFMANWSNFFKILGNGGVSVNVTERLPPGTAGAVFEASLMRCLNSTKDKRYVKCINYLKNEYCERSFKLSLEDEEEELKMLYA